MQRMPSPPFPCLVLAHYHSVHQLLRQCFISLREEQRGWGRSCLLLCGCPERPEGWDKPQSAEF